MQALNAMKNILKSPQWGILRGRSRFPGEKKMEQIVTLFLSSIYSLYKILYSNQKLFSTQNSNISSSSPSLFSPLANVRCIGGSVPKKKEQSQINWFFFLRLIDPQREIENEKGENLQLSLIWKLWMCCLQPINIHNKAKSYNLDIWFFHFLQFWRETWEKVFSTGGHYRCLSLGFDVTIYCRQLLAGFLFIFPPIGFQGEGFSLRLLWS